MTRRRNASDRGLTLIELVVALGVFALVAVMGVQSLSISLNLRDRLSASASETDALGQGVALLRNDLSAALPLLFYRPGKGAPASALRPFRGGQGFSLSVGGQPGIVQSSGAADATQKQRVDWRYHPNSQSLTRQAWPTLYPVNASQQGPEMPVFEGVTSLAFRSFWAGQGWVPGLIPPADAALNAANVSAGDGDRNSGVAPEIYSDTLPHAVEITLEIREFGQIVLLEYIQ